MCTNIIWKEGIQPLGGSQETYSNSPTRKRRMETKSFFKWFRDTTDPVSDDIAEIFKEDIWNNPLQYYLVPDIESNEPGSSPSDSSDTEEPRRRDKTERIVTKPTQTNRLKSSTLTNVSSVSEMPSASSTVTGSSTESRSGELNVTCDGGDGPETGNTGERETVTASTSGSTSTGSNSTVPRRRMYDYGQYSYMILWII